jgi:hypothetical protein
MEHRILQSSVSYVADIQRFESSNTKSFQDVVRESAQAHRKNLRLYRQADCSIQLRMYLLQKYYAHDNNYNRTEIRAMCSFCKKTIGASVGLTTM